jgi:hypothetical protein
MFVQCVRKALKRPACAASGALQFLPLAGQSAGNARAGSSSWPGTGGGDMRHPDTQCGIAQASAATTEYSAFEKRG